MKKILILLAALASATACQNSASTPKPRAYPKVEYPEKVYQAFDENYCQFTFQYPAYAQIQQDTLFFDEKPADPCWFDIFFPAFDCRIYCSYYPVGAYKSFEELKSDAFELADWHQKKANYIDELRIDLPDKKLYGFVFVIEGPAASPFQFYLTDSTRHFLRGALYFNTKVQPDSLAPIYEFVKEDALHMIQTMEWH